MGFSVGAAAVVSLLFPAIRSSAENPDGFRDVGLLDVGGGDMGGGGGGGGVVSENFGSNCGSYGWGWGKLPNALVV